MASLTLKNGKSIILSVGQYCSKDLKHKGLLDCTVVSVKLDCHKKIKIEADCDNVYKYINNEDHGMKKEDGQILHSDMVVSFQLKLQYTQVLYKMAEVSLF